MESFFSLFDPADSVPRPRKERRRHRKPEPDRSGGGRLDHGVSESRRSVERKSEPRVEECKGSRRNSHDDVKCEKKKKPTRGAHVPEESSFLCEPLLSADVLGKDVSYLDAYIDMSYERGESKPKELADKKKRNSGRKSRRKKKSPPKDFIPKQCWNVENLFYPEYAAAYLASRRSSEEKVAWNNKSGGCRHKNSNLGKNVNDLSSEVARADSVEKDFDFNKCKRKAEPLIPESGGETPAAWRTERVKRTGDVMEELARASLQEELYLAGDWSTDELEAEYDDSQLVQDSWSELEEESGDEVYGSLPPEPQLGNVEYKLQLVNPSDKRFQHLATQLKWRLRSGGGTAVYVIGVRDCGALRGLRARALRASLHTLRKMAAALRATLTNVTARRVAPQRAVAEVYIRKLADTQRSVELRVAVMGANEAGKSTLIGVLTQGELDNGRGSARLNMFRHLHEVRSGRTSSLSHEILGFDAQGNVVNYGCSELMTAERIGERSAKLLSFLDLAGHSKYQRTTVHGLTGYCPHYAMLVMSATAGISRMTLEHLRLLLALDLPFFIVVTRTDLASEEPHTLLQHVQEILTSAGCTLRPQLLYSEQQARTCAQPAQTHLLDRVDIADTADSTETTPSSLADKGCEVVPVFPVSCVTGRGLSALHAYLLALQPPRAPLSAQQQHPEEEACEFQIDEIFRVGESCGPVVGGLLARGTLCEGDSLLVGPLDSGDFVPIKVKTIYRNRVPCGSVRAGQSASLGLDRHLPALRQGMVLLAVPTDYSATDACSNIPDDKYRPGDRDSLKFDNAKQKNVKTKTDHLNNYMNNPKLNVDSNNAGLLNALNMIDCNVATDKKLATTGLDRRKTEAVDNSADRLNNYMNSHNYNTIIDRKNTGLDNALKTIELVMDQKHASTGLDRWKTEAVENSADHLNNYLNKRNIDSNNAGLDNSLDKIECEVGIDQKHASTGLDHRKSQAVENSADKLNIYINNHNIDSNNAGLDKALDTIECDFTMDQKHARTGLDRRKPQAVENSADHLHNYMNNHNIDSNNAGLDKALDIIECDFTMDQKHARTGLDRRKPQAVENSVDNLNIYMNNHNIDSNNAGLDKALDIIECDFTMDQKHARTGLDRRKAETVENSVDHLNNNINKHNIDSHKAGLNTIECVLETDQKHASTGLDCRKAQAVENSAAWDLKSNKRREGDDVRDLYTSDTQSNNNEDEEELLLEDPNNPRGSLYFQATVHVLQHSTAIYPGFQATVHIGNIRQTAIIEGIMCRGSVLRAGERASVLLRFVRQPEYVRAGRKMLFRAGLETRGVGLLTQVFPVPPAAPTQQCRV